MSEPPPISPPICRETAMLAWIHDHAPYGVITTDRELRIQSWNRWTEVHSARKSETVIGRGLLDLFPELRERGLEMRFQRALEGEICVLSTALHGYLLPMEPPVRDAGFTLMQQTARIAPLIYLQNILGVIIVIEDVTHREIQASILRRQHERDRILAWALAHLIETTEPRRTVRDLFFKVAERFDFDAYLLYLLEPDRKVLKLHAAGGVSPDTERTLATLDADQALGAVLLNLPEAQAYERLEKEHSGASFAQQLGLRACVVLPLATVEGSLGGLCLGTRSRDVLKEGELDLLSTIGKYLALALQREATGFQLSAAQAKLNRYAEELEAQVAERTANLRNTIGELETFSYTLAHDLRAPIRALIGYSEALIEDYSSSFPAEGRDMVERLHRACTQLDRLTKDLLEYSRVSRQDMHFGPIDLEALIREIIALLRPPVGSVDLRLPLHRVLAHRSSLQQCLSNLLDNALKFSKDGHPPKVRVWTELSAEPLRPEVAPHGGPFNPAPQAEPAVGKSPNLGGSVAPATPKVRIIVEDEGIGIPAEAYGKIFGIFERGTSSPKYPGSGIGLAIVARAVQRMGGACGVDSKPGVGSRFWLELPQA